LRVEDDDHKALQAANSHLEVGSLRGVSHLRVRSWKKENLSPGNGGHPKGAQLRFGQTSIVHACVPR